MATSGAHGLVAIARIAPGRRAVTIGSSFTLPSTGMGGGPSGRPFTIDFRPMSVGGCGVTVVLLPAFARAPCSIHSLSVARDASAILLPLGGIFGSSRCAESV